ncbi:ubiquinone anaerobic biosynthesis accessory factor UbiT [Endozoicomonadaceae bacterium StTr2]
MTPTLLKETLKRLPQPKLAHLMQPLRLVPFELKSRPLELALNKLLKQPLQDGDFDFLEGQWVQIEMTDVAQGVAITCVDERLVIEPPGAEADVTMRGNVDAFVKLATRQEDPDTLFFQRQLSIEGSVELGLGIKNLLDSLDIEQLPYIVRMVLKNPLYPSKA